MFRKLHSQFFLVSVILTRSDQRQGSKACLMGYYRLSYPHTASPFFPSLPPASGRRRSRQRRKGLSYISALPLSSFPFGVSAGQYDVYGPLKVILTDPEKNQRYSLNILFSELLFVYGESNIYS